MYVFPQLCSDLFRRHKEGGASHTRLRPSVWQKPYLIFFPPILSLFPYLSVGPEKELKVWHRKEMKCLFSQNCETLSLFQSNNNVQLNTAFSAYDSKLCSPSSLEPPSSVLAGDLLSTGPGVNTPGLGLSPVSPESDVTGDWAHTPGQRRRITTHRQQQIEQSMFLEIFVHIPLPQQYCNLSKCENGEKEMCKPESKFMIKF